MVMGPLISLTVNTEQSSGNATLICLAFWALRSGFGLTTATGVPNVCLQWNHCWFASAPKSEMNILPTFLFPSGEQLKCL